MRIKEFLTAFFLLIFLSSCSYFQSAPTTLGPIVGDTSDTTAKIWYHDEDKPDLQVLIYEKDSTDPNCVVYLEKEPFNLLNNSNSSSLAKIGSLTPDSTYYYKVLKEGAAYEPRICNYNKLYRFRTFPAQGQKTDFSFGLTSCFKPLSSSALEWFYSFFYKRPNTRWGKLYNSLGSTDASFVLAMGDQIYADYDKKKLDVALNGTEAEQFDFYSKLYSDHWKYSKLRKTMANYPTYMVWDDHDIINGWGSENKHENQNYQSLFKGAARVYDEYQNSHNPDPVRAGERYYGFYYGNAAFLVLDLKSHRKIWKKVVNFPEDDNYLGKEQIGDIAAFIKDAEENSDILFVVTSVPMAYVSDKINDGLISYNQWIQMLKKRNPDLKEKDIPELKRLREIEKLINDEEVPSLLKKLRGSAGVPAMMSNIKKGEETSTEEALREIDKLVQGTGPALMNMLKTEGKMPAHLMGKPGPGGEAPVPMTAMEMESYVSTELTASLICKLRNLSDYFSDLRDQWSYKGNTKVRNRLLNELYDNYMTENKKEVFILGGDSHVSVESTLTNNDGKTIRQFMSSPMYRTDNKLYPLIDGALLKYNKCFYDNKNGNFDMDLGNGKSIHVENEDKNMRLYKNSYGIVNVNWENGEGKVTYGKMK